MEFHLADLFEHVVDAVGERDALYANGKTLTYRELDRRANRLAHHLTAVGIGAGDHVGCHTGTWVTGRTAGRSATPGGRRVEPVAAPRTTGRTTWRSSRSPAVRGPGALTSVAV